MVQQVVRLVGADRREDSETETHHEDEAEEDADALDDDHWVPSVLRRHSETEPPRLVLLVDFT